MDKISHFHWISLLCYYISLKALSKQPKMPLRAVTVTKSHHYVAVRLQTGLWTCIACRTPTRPLIEFWQTGLNICFKQKTSAYFRFVFHKLKAQPAKT